MAAKTLTRQEVLKQLKILNVQQCSLETECRSANRQLHSKDPRNFGDMMQSVERVFVRRCRIENRLKRTTDEIRKNMEDTSCKLKGFSERREDGDVLSDGDLSVLREAMCEVSVQLEDFKSKQGETYAHLMTECNVYVSELEALHRRLTFDTNLPSKKKPAARPLNQRDPQPNSELPSEVVAYQNYLVLNGGLTGGWNDFDHSDFTKIYRRHVTNPEVFMREAMICLPGKTIEAIKEHRLWYERFQELLDANKQAIVRWKQSKVYQIKIKTDSEKSENPDLDLARLKLAALREKKARNAQKEEVLAWREKKRVEEAAAEQERLERIRIKTAAAQEAREERLQEQRIAVDEYRTAKLTEEAERLEAQTREMIQAGSRRKAEVARNVQKFEARDRQILSKRLESQRYAEAEKEARQRRLERAKSSIDRPTAKRDFDRLTRPTTASRRRAEAEKGSAGCVVGARGMPTRAIPTWRQNM